MFVGVGGRSFFTPRIQSSGMRRDAASPWRRAACCPQHRLICGFLYGWVSGLHEHLSSLWMWHKKATSSATYRDTTTMICSSFRSLDVWWGVWRIEGDLEQAFPLIKQLPPVNLTSKSAKWDPRHREKHVLSRVCSLSVKLKSSCSDNVCGSSILAQRGSEVTRRGTKTTVRCFIFSAGGRGKAPPVTFYLQHSLRRMFHS